MSRDSQMQYTPIQPLHLFYLVPPRHVWGATRPSPQRGWLKVSHPPHTSQLSKALAFAAVASASAFVAPAGFTAQPKVRKCIRPSPQCPLCPDKKHKG